MQSVIFNDYFRSISTSINEMLSITSRVFIVVIRGPVAQQLKIESVAGNAAVCCSARAGFWYNVISDFVIIFR